jgi:hypothetical protein
MEIEMFPNFEAKCNLFIEVSGKIVKYSPARKISFLLCCDMHVHA